MSRRRWAAVAAAAALLVAAVLALRAGVQPQPSVIGPDGQRIVAFHDPAVVTPPQSTEDRPQPPGPLHTDPRRGGTVVSWDPAPYGFEVRWGRAGAPLDGLRYVAGPSIGLDGLPRGRYQIEVRTVGKFGHRSEPSSTETDVDDDPPPWQQGYGFLEDLTESDGLPPTRWKLSDEERQCATREGARGPVVLGGCRSTQLRPVSPLVLGDAEADGVRGRLVVLADTPAPSWITPLAPPRGWPNNLVIAVRPPPTADDPAGGVTLAVGAGRVAVSLSTQDRRRPVEHNLDDSSAGSPGALRRWELIFRADRIEVRRDGRSLGMVDYRPSWSQAVVEISGLALGNTENPPGARVALVGLTGPVPDGRPVELVELEASTSDTPSKDLQFTAVPSVGTAVSARVTGEIAAAAAGPEASLPAAADVVVEAGGRELAVQRLPMRLIDRAGYRFTADIPVEALQRDRRLALRSPTGADFWAYDLLLELTHAPGTQLAVTQPPELEAYPLRPARPTVVVRQDGRALDRGERIGRGKLDVEVHLDSLIAQSYAGSLLGWVALRADLNGRRVLDLLTAADGPAVAGSYQFTIDISQLPDGEALLAVSLVPDRPGIARPSDSFRLRLGN